MRGGPLQALTLGQRASLSRLHLGAGATIDEQRKRPAQRVLDESYDAEPETIPTGTNDGSPPNSQRSPQGLVRVKGGEGPLHTEVRDFGKALSAEGEASSFRPSR